MTRRPYAAVQVERTGVRPPVLTVVGPVRLVRPGTLLSPLPPDLRVVDPEGVSIAAAGRFYLTTETCDPYHLLVDVLSSEDPFLDLQVHR